MLKAVLLVTAAQAAVTATQAPQPPTPIPAGAIGSWITIQDYPAEALTQRQQGAVAFALDIDRDGRVAGCRIVHGSGAASLDAATCALLFVRGRFAPARDASGASVAGSFSSRVRWQYPAKIEDAPAPAITPVEIGDHIRSGEGSSILWVGTSGLIDRCEHANKPYDNVLALPDICRIFPVGMRYGPPGLQHGTPAKRKVTIKLSVYDVNVR